MDNVARELIMFKLKPKLKKGTWCWKRVRAVRRAAHTSSALFDLLKDHPWFWKNSWANRQSAKAHHSSQAY
jgi:hypothetical protein